MRSSHGGSFLKTFFPLECYIEKEREEFIFSEWSLLMPPHPPSLHSFFLPLHLSQIPPHPPTIPHLPYSLAMWSFRCASLLAGCLDGDHHHIEMHSQTFIQLEAGFTATGLTRVLIVGPLEGRQWLFLMIWSIGSWDSHSQARGGCPQLDCGGGLAVGLLASPSPPGSLT